MHEGLATQGLLCTGIDDEIYVESDSRILVSNNYGKDWFHKVLYSDNFAPSVNCFARGNDGIVYAGTTIGVYFTADKGNTWHHSDKGMDNDYIKSLFVTSDGNILAGVESQDYTLYSSSDKGESWVKTESVQGQTITSFAENSKGVLFAGGKFKFYKSSDKGKTWTSSIAPGTFSTDIICDKYDNIYASFSEGGVFMSADGGATWQELNSGLKSDMAKSVNKLMIDRNGYIYAGTNGGGIYKSRKAVY